MDQARGPLVTLADVKSAARRIAGAIEQTPCLRSSTLSRLTGAEVFLKFENLQFTASFKERGALNKLLSLGDVGLPYEISPADLSRRRRHLGVLRVPGGALAQDPLQQPKRTTHLNASTAGVSLVMGRATNGAPQDPPLHESPRAVPKRALTRERERERQFP